MLVDSYLAQSAEIVPDKTAIVCAGARWTYRQIHERARAMARTLIDAGVAPGDRVLICLENSAEAIVSMFGALQAGAVFVIVNPQTRIERLTYLLQDSGASALIARPRHIEALAAWPVLRSLRAVITVGGSPRDLPPHINAIAFEAAASDAPPVLPALSELGEAARVEGSERREVGRVEGQLAALVYTSGSTGAAKGVMLTHRNLTAAAESICAYLEITADDVILSALPLSFTYGLGQITTAFRCGATVVLERSFAYSQTIVDTLVRERVTGFPIVPTLATLLLQQQLPSTALTSVRYITNAAAALPSAKIQALQTAFPRAAIFSMYGQTECQRVSYLPPQWLSARPASVGIPIPGTRVSIVDANGCPVLPGTVGELVVEGPHVMAGYWNDPEATRRALRPGPYGDGLALYTGDLFHMDADGCLYFVARNDDIIKTRGEKVAPRAVEEAIAAMPGVAEVAVFGVPNDLLGEAVAAAIIPYEGAVLTRDLVRQHCRRRLEEFMIPTIVEIRDALPTTLSGKVNRRELRAALQGQAPVLSGPAIALRVEK